MKVYPENYQVSLSVDFIDLNGDSVTPTDILAALYDAEDNLVVDFGSLPFVASDGRKEIVIAPAFNILGVDELEGGRILRVEIVTAQGSIRRSYPYIIAGETRLELMVNSFMTMETAELVARNVPNLGGWTSASEEARYVALIEAFNRLVRIPMVYADQNVAQRAHCEITISRERWQELTADDFDIFPTAFRKALRSAQLLEANEILEGDEFGRRHRAGVISETVGESSVMLRGGAIDHGVSSQTLKALTGYIHFNYRIVRS